jgi:hypothetical protein
VPSRHTRPPASSQPDRTGRSATGLSSLAPRSLAPSSALLEDDAARPGPCPGGPPCASDGPWEWRGGDYVCRRGLLAARRPLASLASRQNASHHRAPPSWRVCPSLTAPCTPVRPSCGWLAAASVREPLTGPLLAASAVWNTRFAVATAPSTQPTAAAARVTRPVTIRLMEAELS